jgi:hypothetical protein
MPKAPLYCHVYEGIITRVLDWMNGFIYSLYTTPVIIRNYSTIATSALNNSLLHTHQSSPGNAIKTCNYEYNSLTELHTPNITHEVFSSQPHSCS